jgi:hypothetical protein
MSDSTFDLRRAYCAHRPRDYRDRQLLAEQQKLNADERKLNAEAHKPTWDRWLAPVLALIATIGSLLGVATSSPPDGMLTCTNRKPRAQSC